MVHYSVYRNTEPMKHNSACVRLYQCKFGVDIVQTSLKYQQEVNMSTFLSKIIITWRSIIIYAQFIFPFPCLLIAHTDTWWRIITRQPHTIPYNLTVTQLQCGTTQYVQGIILHCNHCLLQHIIGLFLVAQSCPVFYGLIFLLFMQRCSVGESNCCQNGHFNCGSYPPARADIPT